MTATVMQTIAMPRKVAICAKYSVWVTLPGVPSAFWIMS